MKLNIPKSIIFATLLLLSGVIFFAALKFSQDSVDDQVSNLSPAEIVLRENLKKESAQTISYKSILKISSLRTEYLPEILQGLEAGWSPAYGMMLLEIAHLSRNPYKRKLLLDFIIDREKLGLDKETDDQLAKMNSLFVHYWNLPEADYPEYALFKAGLYKGIDSRFENYFKQEDQHIIRLDEIRWGGVLRDGIPPLKDPEMISVAEATYLQDTDVVFGVYLNGIAKAYPKRILAWHGMVKDHFGETSICGVYCTLCGSMIVYDTRLNNIHFELGTSGFLYRSNKLMYDHTTECLWSTLEGKPVVGKLVDQQIQLNKLSVVTSNWKEWRTRHPETLVLSLNTGHLRDYGEGIAYKDYFADDQLMFPVPNMDQRLQNKAEVLALSWDSPEKHQLAIDAQFLSKNPLFQMDFHGHKFIVLTDRSGANRVYTNTLGIQFTSYDRDYQLHTSSAEVWEMDELQLTGPENQTLHRLPQHRAFWFGWHAAYPESELIK